VSTHIEKKEKTGKTKKERRNGGNERKKKAKL